MSTIYTARSSNAVETSCNLVSKHSLLASWNIIFRKTCLMKHHVSCCNPAGGPDCITVLNTKFRCYRCSEITPKSAKIDRYAKEQVQMAKKMVNVSARQAKIIADFQHHCWCCLIPILFYALGVFDPTCSICLLLLVLCACAAIAFDYFDAQNLAIQKRDIQLNHQ